MRPKSVLSPSQSHTGPLSEPSSRARSQSESKKLTAFYNEIEPFAAQWLRNLIDAGHIAPGVVDERDIQDIVPAELMGYTQVHLFAGIGVWSYALRQAGWPDDRPVWTGSCPCQPFSAAGKGAGFDDERHLWPAFFHLIEQCQPPTVFGEQVTSKDGLAWLDLVHTDMERAGYAFAPFDLCAAGFGAPHIRQRLYFVGDSTSDGRQQRWQAPSFALQGKCSERTGKHEEPRESGLVEGLGGAGELGYADGAAREWVSGGLSESEAEGCCERQQDGCQRDGPPNAGTVGVTLGDANHEGLEGRRLSAERARELFAGQAGVAGFWRDADWIWCRDEKYRPVESGTFPLAYESPSRVGRLRAYGNAIVADKAKEFVAAFLQSESDSLKVN